MNRWEKRFHEIFETTFDGVWEWNIETDVAECNHNYYAMLGYTAEDFPEKTAKALWLDLVHPSEVEKVIQRQEAHFAESDQPISQEYRMLCKDGSYRWVLDRGRVTERNARGEAILAMGVNTDITETNTGGAGQIAKRAEDQSGNRS